jgi:uncharacterized protein YjaZ|tara:strand:- start:1148 stop:1609 length:462 start_codon:yes stop_codon:yes gene_type:complete
MKLPVWVQYTDKVEGGDQFLFRMRINPKYIDDKGLIAHEYEHVRQWYTITAMTLAINCILAVIVMPSLLTDPYVIGLITAYSALAYHIVVRSLRRIRLRVESICYARQIEQYGPKHHSQHMDYFAKVLSEKYDLQITKEVARKSISAELFQSW